MLKDINEFYKHPDMPDGHVNKCKECNKIDNKISNGIHKRICKQCSKEFKTTMGEISSGGGIYCSRICYLKMLPMVIKRDELSPNWKGDNVKRMALHNWVMRKLGKPTKCEHCGTDGLTGHKIHWANKQHKYKRDINDWLRLCTLCHAKYDKLQGLRFKKK
jgi:hypothetical protein